MQYHASRAAYGPMLAAGVGSSVQAGFLPHEVAVMDSPRGALATVGSSNLDPVQPAAGAQTNVFVRDDAFAAG